MTRLLDIYRSQLKTNIALNLQYRASLVIWLIGMVLEPLVYLIVWSTVAAASGGKLAGFSGRDFAAYYIVLMVVQHLTFTWIMWEYEYRVRYGTFSFALLKPLHPIHADIAGNVGYKALTVFIMAPAALLLGLLFRAELHPPLWAVLAFLPAVALAFLTRFLLEWTLAMAVFWTTRVEAINQTYYVIYLFASGLIAPLELMPPAARTAATLLPFRWLVAFPVELALGRLDPAQALTGFAAQVGWLLASLALLWLIWRHGIRRYSAVGQ